MAGDSQRGFESHDLRSVISQDIGNLRTHGHGLPGVQVVVRPAGAHAVTGCFSTALRMKSLSSGAESMSVIVARSKGHRSTVWLSVRYQESQPVFHTVGPIASATASLNRSVASSVTSTVSNSPRRYR